MARAASRYASLRRHKKRLEHLLLVGVIVILAITPSIYRTQIKYHDALQVWFFDVGQGDSIFIQTPEGKQILIDGGPDDTVLQKLSGVMLPWDRTLDAIIISHPDADHVTGFVEVLKQYRVDRIIETGTRGDTPIIDALSGAIESEHASHEFVAVGDVLNFNRLQVEVLWPNETHINEAFDDRNNLSLVLLATFGATSILFTGDAEEEVETALAPNLPDIDVLKAGHHGSVSSSTAILLQQTKPDVTVISAGEDNRYGHPHPVVLSRLHDAGSKIYRTDQDGDVLLISTGGEPEVKSMPLLF